MLTCFANSYIDWLMNPCNPYHKVPRTSIISESEIQVYSLQFFVCYVHPITQQYESKSCSKSMSVIKVAIMKNMMVMRAPVIVWNWSIRCPFLSAVFNSLHSSTNQELFEKYLYNKSSDYEKYNFSLCKGSHYMQPLN